MLFNTQSYLTGIYASPVGCLQSYYAHQKAIIAPTISYPDVSYSPDYHFFDPDEFIALSAMLHAGDDYLTSQVKDVLVRRTGNTMCGLGTDIDHIYCHGQESNPGQHTKHIKSRANITTNHLLLT